MGGHGPLIGPQEPVFSKITCLMECFALQCSICLTLAYLVLVATWYGTDFSCSCWYHDCLMRTLTLIVTSLVKI